MIETYTDGSTPIHNCISGIYLRAIGQRSGPGPASVRVRGVEHEWPAIEDPLGDAAIKRNRHQIVLDLFLDARRHWYSVIAVPNASLLAKPKFR